MKIKTIICLVLNVIAFALGGYGILAIIGTAGSLERDLLTFAQAWFYAFNAFAMILVAVVVYNIKEIFKHNYIEK